MAEAPDKIYLQIEDVDDVFHSDGVSWCADKINDTDVEYIRADLSMLVEYKRCLKCGEADTQEPKTNTEGGGTMI